MMCIQLCLLRGRADCRGLRQCLFCVLYGVAGRVALCEQFGQSKARLGYAGCFWPCAGVWSVVESQGEQVGVKQPRTR